MTLEEYEKVREEKRKALLALKSEERKVSVDKDLEAMQLLSSKKSDDEVFVKLVKPIDMSMLFKFMWFLSVNELSIIPVIDCLAFDCSSGF